MPDFMLQVTVDMYFMNIFVFNLFVTSHLNGHFVFKFTVSLECPDCMKKMMTS